MGWYQRDRKLNTGLVDENGDGIWVGDILESIDGYRILVCQYSDTKGFYGSLICPIDHSCRNIPYALNDGKGYIVAYY